VSFTLLFALRLSFLCYLHAVVYFVYYIFMLLTCLVVFVITCWCYLHGDLCYFYMFHIIYMFVCVICHHLLMSCTCLGAFIVITCWCYLHGYVYYFHTCYIITCLCYLHAYVCYFCYVLVSFTWVLVFFLYGFMLFTCLCALCLLFFDAIYRQNAVIYIF